MEQEEVLSPSWGDWKKELVKLAGIMIVAAAVLGIFIQYPTLPVVLAGVIGIGLTAYISERGVTGYNKVLLVRKAVLVTGCDTGFGYELARHLSADLGILTFAGCLHADGKGAQTLEEAGEDRIRVLQMDVTSGDQVQKAVEGVEEDLAEANYKLWGIVNNAGLNFLGDVELTTMHQYEKCVQINYLGMVRVTKAFLPMVRACQGRVVNVTSVKGTFSEPCNAAYAATKFAGEAFSDSLRREMKGFGVNVSIIQPCNFGGATDCVNEERMKKDFDEMWGEATEEVKDTYGRDYLDYHNTLVKNAIPQSCFDLTRVTQAIDHALMAEYPNTRYLINGGSGWMDIYWIRSKLVHHLPTSWFDAWLRRDIRNNPKPLGYVDS